MRRWRFLILIVPSLLALLAWPTARGQGPMPDHGDFDRVIAPLLTRHCLDCHSGTKPRGGLDLTRRQTTLAGGDRGAAVVPGKPGDGVLWEYVAHGKMPPKKPLAAAEKALLKAWIEAGAPWGTDPIDPFRFTTERRAGYDWWSLRPVQRPSPPVVKQAGWPLNPIDHFILAKLEEKRLAPSPDAELRVLIRRLYFDLIGLPPPPEEVDRFVSRVEGHTKRHADSAIAEVADRLLASPHYGERWARHWLDVVRYGESDGFERNNPRPDAWPYRDWVVSAFNRDLPFDEFARLQIAGDVLRADDPAAVSATGFLVAGIHNTVVGQNEVMRLNARQDELEDLVATVGQTFLGLTVHCARCHDHKFDPVSQKDYYRLVASLAGVHHAEEGPPDAKGAKKNQPKSTMYVVSPKPPPPTHVLARGDVLKKLELAAPAGVAALGGENFDLAADAPEAERRKKLAAWIARADNPLFARVIVNRLWHHHFGVGLVETPSDFGFNGGRPSHFELLDWLASELVRQRFSLKAIHRLIVTSRTYRQSSRARGSAKAADANNRLLWRKTPMRMDAESLRDAILAVAGRLNTNLGGPGFHDVRTYHNSGTTFYEPIDPVGKEFNRRTLYRFSPRGERQALLDTFDCPDPSSATPRRQATTTPLQALALLNSPFVLRMADHFAERVQVDSKADNRAAGWVRRAYQLAFARSPSAEEIRHAATFVERHGLAALCRILFNSNEFVLVE